MTRPPTKRPPNGKLSSAGRTAARMMAEELIALLWAERDVAEKVAEKFRVSMQVARAVYREAAAALKAADDGDRPERIARNLAAIGKLYRDAHAEKRYAVCRQLLADIRRVHGLDAPLKVQGLPPAVESDLTSRTDAELEFYSDNGYWPEEAPRPTDHPGVQKKTPSPATALKLH
jgi:hypothetical protein